MVAVAVAVVCVFAAARRSSQGGRVVFILCLVVTGAKGPGRQVVGNLAVVGSRSVTLGRDATRNKVQLVRDLPASAAGDWTSSELGRLL
jgi:hypothetical protein